jgi:5-methylcytosine-specific restriction endonuclease McrA
MGKFSGHVTKGQRWRALRAQVLRRDRHTCQGCGKRGRLEVDHKQPVRTHPRLAWDPANLQALCPACHTRKTNAELGRTEASPARDKWRAAVRALERDGRKPSSERKPLCSIA